MKTYAIAPAVSAFCLTLLSGCGLSGNEEERKVTDYREMEVTVASETLPGIFDAESQHITTVYAVKKPVYPESVFSVKYHPYSL